MASPGLLSALQQDMPIEQYYSNIRNFASSARSPQELVAAAQQLGISGEDIMNATGEMPLSAYDRDSNPMNPALAQALESIPTTINTGVQYNPQTRDVDQGVAAQSNFNVVNPRTGQMENVTPASEVIPGAPANQFVVSSGQGVFEQNGKSYQPVNLVTVDASGNVIPSGMFNIEKNELSAFNRIATAIATSVAAAAMGPALGAALGLSGTAATVVGNALVNGSLTGVITGDAEKAAFAALSSAAGSYISSSGIVSDALESIGLTDVADFLDTNLVTKSVSDATSNGTLSSVVDTANNVITTIGKNIGVNTVSDAIAAASTGLLSTAADGTQTVTQTGTRPTTTQPTTGEALLTGTANVAVTDLPGGGQQVTQTGTPTTQQPTVGDGLLSGAANVTLTDLPGGGQEIVQTETPKPKTPITPQDVVLPAAITTLLSGNPPPAETPTTPDGGKTDLTTLLGVGGLLSGLLGTGIDATLLNEIENLSAGKAEDVRRAFEGAAKDVQFTPYTVTTGLGSTAFGTDAAGRPTATATASPEYQALRNQALQQAGTALGSINPADSAQALYDRARSLSAPTEQRQQEQLLSNLGARGLLGIGRNLPTVGGTTAAVNPYVESLLSAQRTADANLALQSQQFGTQEAMRQQQLAQALQGQGMAVDTAAQGLFAPSLSFGTQAAATAGQSADRSLRATQLGETLATTYDLANLDARTQLLRAQAEAAKGVTSNVLPKFLDLFGL
jgi:hypothetical protein